MTLSEMIIDEWAHRHADDPSLSNVETDDDYDSTLRDLGLDPAEVMPDPGETEVVEEVTYGGTE
jgi:hypothetical protein